MRTIIFANGEISDYEFVKNEMRGGGFVLCCDGGLRHADRLGVTPDLILGDLDSADAGILKRYETSGVPVESFPSEKDFTDLELAVQKAVRLGADEILIFGGTGGRLDHTLGNAHTLLFALENGVAAYLIDEKNRVCLISKEIVLDGKEGDLVSLIPLTERVTGVTTEGLYYLLSDETLQIGSSRGISNLFISDRARIQISGGYLFVIRSKE